MMPQRNRSKEGWRDHRHDGRSLGIERHEGHGNIKVAPGGLVNHQSRSSPSLPGLPDTFRDRRGSRYLRTSSWRVREVVQTATVWHHVFMQKARRSRAPGGCHPMRYALHKDARPRHSWQAWKIRAFRCRCGCRHWHRKIYFVRTLGR
jgi:hypothetical protein